MLDNAVFIIVGFKNLKKNNCFVKCRFFLCTILRDLLCALFNDYLDQLFCSAVLHEIES